MPRRLPSSRGLSRMAGWSTSIWIMVGTSSVWVTRSRSIASSTASGLNIGITTCVLPWNQCGPEMPMSARWNIGAACR